MSPPTKEHHLVTIKTDGKEVNHRDIEKIVFFCDGRRVTISLNSLRDNFRDARTKGIMAEMGKP